LQDMDNEQTFDAIINLTGEPIADRRWGNLQKQRILDSRVNTTNALVDYMKAATTKPKVFISASAIGYYGVGTTDEAIDEMGLSDDSFSSELCKIWEATATQAESLGVRTCLLRTGIVLGKGGALSKMVPPFKLGLGGQIGTGSQWMSWIHINDLVGIILHCIETDELKGPVNGTAPNPVTNKVFTESLGKVLKRPTLLPMPSRVVRLLMGQMGEELLLSGKKIVPVKVLGTGYIFQYEILKDALEDLA